nr:AraC family transcriptional regulator [Nisaea denitrificans]
MKMVRRLIKQNLSSADWIAKHVHVSRTKLYKLFEGLGGVASYVHERRLRKALLALGDQNARHRSIYDVLLDAGDTSDAAFARAFRTRYGMPGGTCVRQA